MVTYKVLFEKLYTILTLMTMGLFFETADGWWGGGGEEGGKGPLPKIFLKYPAVMTLDTVVLTQRRSKKYINQVTHHLSSAAMSIFHRKSANFGTPRITDINCVCIIFNSLTLFEPLKVLL